MPERFIGRTIGQYLVERLLGGGGSAWVFQARDPALEIDVALKVLKPHLADDAAAVERFRREATTAARLRHPNIVIVRAVGRLDEDVAIVPAGTPYLVMDLLPGSLAQRLADGRPLPESELLAIGEDVARALAWAHGHGVIHRDVKPDNVLLDRDGRAVVADFGIARAVAEGLAGSTRSAVVGTPHYFAPEQARGLPLDGRADVYGLGVTLYQAATGVLPFGGDDWYTVMRRHVEEPPVPPHAHNPALSALTEQAILRALAKAPEDRPDAEALWRALASARRALSGEGATVEVPPLPADLAHALRGRPREGGDGATGEAAAAMDGGGAAVAVLTPEHASPPSGVRPVPAGPRPGSRLAESAARRHSRTRGLVAGGVVLAGLGAAAIGALVARDRAVVAPPPAPAPPVDSLARVDTAHSPPAAATFDSAALRADSVRSAPHGSLYVVAPYGANITVNGRFVGRGNWRADSIPPGMYTISAEIPTIAGCTSNSRSRVVRLSANARQRVTLTPEPCAEVALDIKPDGAMWTLTRDGVRVADGRAPAVGTLVVPAGAHRLRVVSRMCATYEEEHTFPADSPLQRVRVRLICP